MEKTFNKAYCRHCKSSICQHTAGITLKTGFMFEHGARVNVRYCERGTAL